MPRQTFFRNHGPFTLAELAEATGAVVCDGVDTSAKINDVAPVSDCIAGEITFISQVRFIAAAAGLEGCACLVSEEHSARLPEGITALVTPRPEAAFAAVIAKFYPDAISRSAQSGAEAGTPVHRDAKLEDGVIVEAGAVIGPDVEIGAGTCIAANAVICAGVKIGRNCMIGPGASIMHALIGNDALVHAGARIGQDGFGFAEGPAGLVKLAQIGRVIVQNHVEIGANSVIDRGMLQDTVIGEGTKIDNLVHVAHNAVIGRSCGIAAQSGIAGSVRVGDGVMIGGQVGTMPHIEIGDGVMVGAGTGIWSSVEPGMRIAGRPHKQFDIYLRELQAIGRLGRPRQKRSGDAT